MFSMQSISLLQIAPTLADFFDVRLVSTARHVDSIRTFMYSCQPQVIVLVIIDSLDFTIYSEFKDELGVLHRLVEDDGLLFSFEQVSNHTTPSIASILTGLLPESHGIRVSADVGTSKVKSILEILDDNGQHTAAIIDTKGAQPLLGKISHVFGIEDREDIQEYDDLIQAHTLTMLKKQDVQLVLAHLRSIDRFAHRGWDLQIAARIINEKLKAIVKAVRERKGMLFICGDHEAHLKERTALPGHISVPLIVACP